jgi:hypothetical protein
VKFENQKVTIIENKQNRAMQQERRTPLPLPDQTELSVLLYLSNYKSSAFKFKDYAINRIEILGSESKSASKTQRDLRRKVVNRINYLKGNLPNLIRLLRKKGLKKIFGQPIDQEPIQIQREEDFHEDLEEQNEILPSFDQLNRKFFCVSFVSFSPTRYTL